MTTADNPAKCCMRLGRASRRPTGLTLRDGRDVWEGRGGDDVSDYVVDECVMGAATVCVGGEGGASRGPAFRRPPKLAGRNPAPGFGRVFSGGEQRTGPHLHRIGTDPFPSPPHPSTRGSGLRSYMVFGGS